MKTADKPWQRWPLLWLSAFALSAVVIFWPTQSQRSDYEIRLARVLEVELLPADQPLLLTPLPSERQLTLAIGSHGDIGLLELLQLGDCQLGEVIARRNSSLGKVAGVSQQLHSARDFIQAAPDCIRIRQRDNPELAGQLQQALTSYQQQWRRYWWNAWVAGPEWRGFASLGAAHRAATGEGIWSASLQALDYALGQRQRWQDGQLDYGSGEMEQSLQTLLQGQALGRWQRTQAEQTAALYRINQMLEQRLQQRPLCPAGRKTPTADILQNVLIRFYVGELQPQLSATDRYGLAVLERLAQLWPQSEGEPPTVWADWLAALQAQRQQLLAASREHVVISNRWLSGCGMAPGQPPS